MFDSVGLVLLACGVWKPTANADFDMEFDG